MITRMNNELIEFAFYRPHANSVNLVGDFSAWKKDAHPMQKDEDGWWRIWLVIPSGTHRFKYFVDGCLWEADFAAYGVENDRLGGWRSVLWVEDRPVHNPSKSAKQQSVAI